MADETEDEQELGEYAPGARSFFALHDATVCVTGAELAQVYDADDEVCDRIWALYLRDSRERVFATEAEAGAALAVNTTEERDTMSDDRDDVLQAYKTLEQRLGRPPTNGEISAHLRLSYPRVSAARASLAEAGHVAKATRGGGRNVAKGPAAAKPRSSTRPKPEASPDAAQPALELGTSPDLTVARLIAKRDEYAAKTAALTLAIEVLQGASK